MNTELYETDYYSWTALQARLLKENRISEMDIKNLIEEITDMGNRHVDAVESLSIVLVTHLLKWQYQPDQRSSSWRGSIVNSRNRIKRILKKNPRIKGKIPEIYSDIYEDALSVAIAETGLKREVFPTENPWTFDEIMELDFFPNN